MSLPPRLDACPIRNARSIPFKLFGALLFLTLLWVSPSAAAGTCASGFVPAYRSAVDGVELDHVGIRFLPETEARVRNGALVSLTGADLSAVSAVVGAIPGAVLRPRFDLPEEQLNRMRALGESRTLQALPDLNLFARIDLPALADEAAARTRLSGLLATLNGAPGVAEAWAFAKAAPSVVDERTSPRSSADAFGGSGRSSLLAPRAGTPRLVRSDTPDFSGLQGYLYDSPIGLWVDSAWSWPGGRGQTIKVLGLEWGQLFTHEDLKPPFYYYNDQGPSDHGTAVIGIIGGQHNGYGINGEAPDAEIGGIFLGADLAGDILRAVSVLSPGDLYNMSIQVSGPENWMPTEYWPDCFAAIQTGAALGVICMEAAGNGSVNLDSALYGGYFDRRQRDSGAIMCGAGTPNGLDGEWFTNYGQRVSLQGWGSSVVTTCCGDLQGGDPELRYTAGFNGTSSATPVCAGAVASFEGQAKALFGEPLTPALVEEILSVTGTPYAGTKPIGERPNLVAARERLLRGFGNVVVTVRDADTQQAMPGMVVEFPETGRLQLTGPAGQIAMQLTAGDLVFRVSGSFYYQVQDFPFTVEQGGHQEVTLDIHRIPNGSLTGVVTDTHGTPLANARITLPGTPIDTVWTGPDGSYTVAGIPEGQAYTGIVSRVPTKGAADITFNVTGGQATHWSPLLADAQTFETSNGNYVPSGAPTGEWEWGTPTFPNGPNRPIPFSGNKVWGTDLDNTYDNMTTSVLTSPEIDLSGTSRLTLSFHHWMWIANDDGGQVQVWNRQTNTWDLVTPVGGYPDDNIIILYYQPGYNGIQKTWEPAIFHLDQYAGGPFKFRLYFKSNYQEVGIGWYVDDVAIDSGNGPVSVDMTPSRPGMLRLLSSGPNPASGTSRVQFLLPARSDVRIDLFDPSGARIRSLLTGSLAAGVHDVLWDGKDDAGRPVGNGVYFYRVASESGSVGGRFVRVR